MTTSDLVVSDNETDKALPSLTIDRRIMRAVPLVLAIALGLLALLPRWVAGSTLTELGLALFVLLAAVDLLTLKVPNLLVYPSIAFLLAGTAIVDVSVLPQALLGGGALLLVMFVLAIIGRGAMGMGDVKFACLTGCALGWKIGLIALASGFALGAGAAIVLLVLRLRGRKDVVPLTPFLAAGAVVWVAMLGSLVS